MCSARFLGHLYIYICLSTFHGGATYVEQSGVKRFISWDIRFRTQQLKRNRATKINCLGFSPRHSISSSERRAR